MRVDLTLPLIGHYTSTSTLQALVILREWHGECSPELRCRAAVLEADGGDGRGWSRVVMTTANDPRLCGDVATSTAVAFDQGMERPDWDHRLMTDLAREFPSLPLEGKFDFARHERAFTTNDAEALLALRAYAEKLGLTVHERTFVALGLESARVERSLRVTD